MNEREKEGEGDKLIGNIVEMEEGDGVLVGGGGLGVQRLMRLENRERTNEREK